MNSSFRNRLDASVNLLQTIEYSRSFFEAQYRQYHTINEAQYNLIMSSLKHILDKMFVPDFTEEKIVSLQKEIDEVMRRK